MSDQTAEKDGVGIWREHCRSAVRKFLMNAVVIDNQPVLEDRRRATTGSSRKVAGRIDDGMDTPVEQEVDDHAASRPSKEKKEDISEDDIDQDLNIRKISDAFTNEQITCSFVLPKDSDKDGKIFDRIVAAAVPSDIVIIDWYLEDKASPELTKKVLRKVAKKDKAEHGRLRLICIYTGQRQIDEITRDAVKELEDGGLETLTSEPENGTARGKHHSLIVLNKQDVTCRDLPDRILREFTELADGLLPSFALAAVAAVRRNVHHIITRFSKELDAAYVANRLITDPPGDVAELIRELFVSECDTALGLEKVADQYLETEQIKKWLNLFEQPLMIGSYKYEDQGTNKTVKIDRDFLDCLLNKGLSGRFIELEGSETEFDEKKREKISHVLHGSKKKAKKGEQEFARFVVLKREAGGNTKIPSEADDNWVPSLTLGTLLLLQQNNGEDKYFYCLTPACDTLRLQGKERTFLALELFKAKGMTNLIIAGPDENIRLFINPRPTNIRTFYFSGDETTGRVMAKRSDKGGIPTFTFTTSDGSPQKLIWLGEVRKHRANRDMAELNRMWLRFGINDSEYLRLAGRGKAEM